MPCANSDEGARLYRDNGARGFRDNGPLLRDDPAWAPRSLTDAICLTRSGFRSSGLGSFSARSAQAFARELDAMRVIEVHPVMNETIKDGVGVGRIADDFMPSRHGKLGGDDRRPAPEVPKIGSNAPSPTLKCKSTTGTALFSNDVSD